MTVEKLRLLIRRVYGERLWFCFHDDLSSDRSKIFVDWLFYVFGSLLNSDYAGTLIDGTEFDSSYARGEPATFAPNQVIGGWTQAMQLMKEGAKWELYIPSELGYGDSGVGNTIKGGDVLVFTLELLKVKGDYVKEVKEYSSTSSYPATAIALLVATSIASIMV